MRAKGFGNPGRTFAGTASMRGAARISSKQHGNLIQYSMGGTEVRESELGEEEEAVSEKTRCALFAPCFLV